MFFIQKWIWPNVKWIAVWMDSFSNIWRQLNMKKTCKLFGESNLGNSKIIKKFIKFVRKNEKLKNETIKKKNLDDDDLGFEINFGAYQSSEPRHQLKKIPETKLLKNWTEGKREKIEIPKKFIKKIRKLGLREQDVGILYKSKIDWTSVYVGKVFNLCSWLDGSLDQFENQLQKIRFFALKLVVIFIRKLITKNWRNIWWMFTITASIHVPIHIVTISDFQR